MSLALYHSDRGLYDFQALIVARSVLQGDSIVAADCGIGKSHVAMALSALLFEDDETDRVLIVCEKDKLTEWVEDFEEFTDLTAVKYAGDAKRRAKLRAGDAQVLVGTYETVRNDASHMEKETKGRRVVKVRVGGPLTEVLAPQRVLFVFDEVTKLRGRSSGIHQSIDYLVTACRKAGSARTTGLTATPVEKSPEDYYNLGRIIAPALAGTVKQFDDDHVVGRDANWKAYAYKNIIPCPGGDCTHRYCNLGEPWVTPLRTKLGRVYIHKSKSDPDVINEFPKRTEEFVHVTLSDLHYDFYDAVRDYWGEEETDANRRALWASLRLAASIPEALALADGKVSQDIAGRIGVEALRALGSPKLERLVHRLHETGEQGAQSIVFTYYGQTVLPLIRQRLEAEGFEVVVNHGQMTTAAKDASKAAFRAGDAQIFLSSDAGAKGINLPQASYVEQFELPVLFSTYIQRMDRAHRIDSDHALLTCNSYVVRGTVEDAVETMVFTINQYHDQLVEDLDGEDESEVLTAEDRKRIMDTSRRLT